MPCICNLTIIIYADIHVHAHICICVYIHIQTARVQALKRSVPKGNKSRKKEVDVEIAQLEEDLRQRQKREIAGLESQVCTKQLCTHVSETQICMSIEYLHFSLL